MPVDSTFAHIVDNQESVQSVNPISIPASSSNTLMGDNTSQNGGNTRGQVPIHGHLGNVDLVEEPDRHRTFHERLALKRTAAPSCIRIPPHAGIFHFRNGMISLLP